MGRSQALCIADRILPDLIAPGFILPDQPIAQGQASRF